MIMLLIWILPLLINYVTGEIDQNGYILYCPCMGRFGNQAEQFLGTLHFAKAIDRTLILPPFIEYVKYKVHFIPFDLYFNIHNLQQYHRVVLMDEFLEQIAPQIWNKTERKIACYSSRNMNKVGDGCNPFEGSPFKDFWHHLGVTEFPAGSLFYSPIHTDYHFASEWKQKYSDVKVLAFVGAPSAFPTHSKAVELQKYVSFSANIASKVNKYREERNFARQPYLSIHLRRGSDWSRACDLLKVNHDLKQLFSSQQCFGDNQANQMIKTEVCMPSVEEIVEKIRAELHWYKENHSENSIGHIHIATDFDNQTLWAELHRHLPEVTLITPSGNIDPSGGRTVHPQAHFITDLYLMSYANLFIGNCISSFSAFASRYRIYNLHFHTTTKFFSYPYHSGHDEL